MSPLAAAIIQVLLPGLAFLPVSPQVSPEPSVRHLPARVDARVELFATVFRLAGSPEYNDPAAEAPYTLAVDTWFGSLREHPAVVSAARLRAERGIGHDAVMELALHLEDAVLLEERVPFDAPDSSLDRRWSAETARAFLVEVRDFARASRFAAFADSQREPWRIAAERLEAVVNGKGVLEFCDAYFGRRKEAEIGVVVGLLNGDHHYGVSVVLADGSHVLSPVFGVWKRDGAGRPVFEDSVVSLAVHELCHTYVNPCVERAPELEAVGQRLFALKSTLMQRQAYMNGHTVLCETLVRACTVRYWLWRGQPAEARKQAQYEHERGFVWTAKLAEALGAFEADRVAYPDFAAFLPRVGEVLAACADEHEAAARLAPEVVALEPASGARDVDPTLGAIVIRFSKPMRDGSWSVVGGGPRFPRLTGPPAYDAAHTTLTLPVALEPGHEYELWLNSATKSGFASADGGVLAPVRVTFRTRD